MQRQHKHPSSTLLEALLVQNCQPAANPTHPFHSNLLPQVEGVLDHAPSVADDTVIQGLMEHDVCLSNLLQRRSDMRVFVLNVMALEALKVFITGPN